MEQKRANSESTRFINSSGILYTFEQVLTFKFGTLCIMDNFHFHLFTDRSDRQRHTLPAEGMASRAGNKSERSRGRESEDERDDFSN